jgi:hypothetical protein
MTYSVKSIYPEFKCLTIFRKVVARIEKKGDIWKARKNLKSANEDWGCQYNKFFKEYHTKLWRESGDEYARLEKEIGITYDENGVGEYPHNKVTKIMVVKYPMLYRYCPYYKNIVGYTDEKLPQKWLWGEQNKYEMMAKKWEFNEAMISRDYKAVTLGDDVIGLVFEYL